MAAFDYQPTLRGALLEARPLLARDKADLYAVASDPLIWEQHPDKTRCTAAGFTAFFEESLASGGALLVIDAATGHAIGSSRFFGHSVERREVEIGWTFLARTHWGGVFNAELKDLMMRHAFRFVDSVIFLVGPDNIRSQRAVVKIGGVLQVGRDVAGRLVYRVSSAAFSAQAGND